MDIESRINEIYQVRKENDESINIAKDKYNLDGETIDLIRVLRDFTFLHTYTAQNTDHLFYTGRHTFDLLPCVLTVITIYTVGSRNTKITRLGSLFASVCWIIYAIAFKSWFVIICESYLAICTTIGLIKYNVKKEQKV